jgi:hypothetical protein
MAQIVDVLEPAELDQIRGLQTNLQYQQLIRSLRRLQVEARNLHDLFQEEAQGQVFQARRQDDDDDQLDFCTVFVAIAFLLSLTAALIFAFEHTSSIGRMHR